MVTVDYERRSSSLAQWRSKASGSPPSARPRTSAEWTSAHRVHCAGEAVIPVHRFNNHLFQTLGARSRRRSGAVAVAQRVHVAVRWARSLRTRRAIAALVGAAQAAAGTTCIIDNHYAPNDLETTLSIASAIDEVELRGAGARGIVGPPTEVARRMN